MIFRDQTRRFKDFLRTAQTEEKKNTCTRRKYEKIREKSYPEEAFFPSKRRTVFQLNYFETNGTLRGTHLSLVF